MLDVEVNISNQPHINVNTFPLGIIILNREGKICYFNDHCKEILEYITKDINWIDILEKNFKSCLTQDVLINKAGRHLSIKTQPYDNNEGQIVLLIDETDIKKSYEFRLKERVKALGILSSTLAHQLKTPLSAAYLYTSNLKYCKNDFKKQEALQFKITKQLDHIKKLIDDVLMLHKSDDIIEYINVVTWLECIIKNYSELYSNRHIIMIENLNGSMPILLGNRAALDGMLHNLLDNAIQASSADMQIEVSVRRNDTHIVISIKDYGHGIPIDKISSIYEPFYTTKQNGTGLGLSIVKSVVQAHGGNLEVNSKVNAYTIITVNLPVVTHG